MKLRKTLKRAAAVLAAVSLLAGCGPTAAYEELQKEGAGTTENAGTPVDPAAKDTLVMAVSTDPANVSPISASTVGSCPIVYNVYTRLLYVDGSEYVMEAAKSVEYEDDTHILVELRDDVYDELGNNMKASDVLFSMKLCLEGAGSNPTYVRYVDFDHTEVTGDYTLRIAMASPYSFQFVYFSYINLVTEAGYNASSDGMVNDVVATGPYRIEEFVGGSSVTLKKNEKWFGDVSDIETVKIQVITEASQITNSFETGEVQMGLVQNSDVAYLDSLDNVNVQEVPNYMLYGMMFNCSEDSVFHSKEARQAVAYAVNQEALLATAMENMGKICISAATTDFNDYSDQWKQKAAEVDNYYAYDLEKAKELAKSSGLEGQTVQLTYTSSQPVQKMMAEIVQAQLLEIGVNAEINVYDDSVYVDTMKTETDWDISFQIYGSLVNSALACMNTFIVAMNLVHLDGEVFEDISSRIAEGVTITDTKERIEKTNELMGLINEEVPIYGLCETSAMYGRADSLNEIGCKILYFPDFTQMSFK